MRPSNTIKQRVFYAFFIAIGLIFVVRLFYIQIIDDSYKLSAKNNVLKYIIEYPARGLVYDRYDKLLLYNEANYDLMVIPQHAKNIDTVDLCHLIGIDKETYKSKMQKAKKYSYFKASIFEKQLSKETYGYLQEKLYKFPGFYVQTRTLRKYPNPMAAHTLGYVGEVSQETTEKDPYYQSGDYIGISGIEKTYEKVLRGRKGLKILMVDVFGREKGSFANGQFDTISEAGSNLYSTIDAELQAYGEKLMSNKIGSIVAIDPNNGEILAMISSPSYDPNLLVGRVRSQNYSILSQDPLKPLFNRALMAMYPPGSTFKLVNALIGQQEKVLFPETRYSCEQGFSLGGGKKVACHVHGSPLDLKASISNSCNAYYCKVFRSIVDKKEYHSTKEGYEVWRKHVLSFGFNNKFDDDLSNELRGNVPSSKYYDRFFGVNGWKSMTIISLSIGQGELGITPLQLANLSAIIANKGYYYTPHLVRSVGNKENIIKKFTEKHKTTIEPKYFDIVIDGMFECVETGTGRTAKMDTIKICAKTGTAQNPHGEDHSIFIAFAPKDNPKIAIAVFVENGGFGATWAAPIAGLMIEKYINRKVNRSDVEYNMVKSNLIPRNLVKQR